MRRHRLMGIDPDALERAMQERRERHRTALDQLRARLAAAEQRLPDLRAEQSTLAAQLARVDAEGQHLLQELNRMGEENDRPLREMEERHRRAEAHLRERIALLAGELEGWTELERQVAEGIMRAVQPYLDLNALHPYQEPSPAREPGPPDRVEAIAALRQVVARAAPGGKEGRGDG